MARHSNGGRRRSTCRAITALALGAGLVASSVGTSCRRNPGAPELGTQADAQMWQAPPTIATPDAGSTWLRRVIGAHHDWIEYVDEPALANDPMLRPVFERVRGRLHPTEQAVRLVALGGPTCSVAGGCRDRVIVVAGAGIDGASDPGEGWFLSGTLPGDGNVYTPESNADEPLMVRYPNLVVTAWGADAGRLYSLLESIGAPPNRIQLGTPILALREYAGGFYYRADPQGGQGRGIIRSTTWLSAGDGVATRSATLYEHPALATEAGQAVQNGASPPGQPGAQLDSVPGQVLDVQGAFLLSRTESVLFAEELMRLPPDTAYAPVPSASGR